jgi:hypothetical protein
VSLEARPNSLQEQEYLPPQQPQQQNEYLPPDNSNDQSPSISAGHVINPDSDGYDYKKPTIGFVTGKKKPLKTEVLAPFNPEEVLSSNQQLSISQSNHVGAQDHHVSTQYQQPFIDAFRSAQSGYVSLFFINLNFTQKNKTFLALYVILKLEYSKTK